MIRFVNESGLGRDTRIIDAATGDELTQTLSIAFGGKVIIGEMITAELELCMMCIDVAAEKTKWMTRHPLSKDMVEMSAIEFRDGTRVEFAEDGSPSVKAGAK